MRIKSITLSWFRGAADCDSLEPNSRSMLVYGMNASGKSCFVDAVEYVLRGGKISHLQHEYSGRRHEKGVLSTHRPKDQGAELRIKFKDESELKIAIEQDGSWKSSGNDRAAMSNWDYRRTVLRQDEVATFIHDTKGNKYSALLPLLGLHPMEVAAENLRQIAKSIEETSKLRESRGKLDVLGKKRTAAFGAVSVGEIFEKLKGLHAKYCPSNEATSDISSNCKGLNAVLDLRITSLSADERRHVALQDTASLDLKLQIEAVRVANGKLAVTIEPLIAEKLEVLKSASAYAEKLEGQSEINCPACGRRLSADAFQVHIESECERLGEIIDIFDKRKSAIGTMCDSVTSMKSSMSKVDVKTWRAGLAEKGMAANFKYLDSANVDILRASCSENDLEALDRELVPLIGIATEEGKEAPPGAEQLSTDKRMVEAVEAVIEGETLAADVKRAGDLVSFINTLEQGVREEIRLRSQSVIDEISGDIQMMWATLHPGEAIEDVRLYVPEDTNKAIDIGLKFYGVLQDSPRLTLSEGYRNSLGLCIFLGMAKREPDKERPIFLDDVVVSFDRNHRGMIEELLRREFSSRQVIIFTHDRDWYTELRHQLDEKIWDFKTLLPYVSPDIGIRWSHKTTTFGDARAHLQERPDAAANDARKIMDVELAIIAERLQIRMPYLRAEKNDKRMAHDFLERFRTDGGKCFQKKIGEEYKPYTTAIQSFEEAARLLSSWGNRGSHTFDVVPAEAAKLIDVCEGSVEFFKCSSCRKPVWFADAEGSRSVQCQCSEIRWRYGKG